MFSYLDKNNAREKGDTLFIKLPTAYMYYKKM